MNNNEVFVKVNYKNIGELKSFIYDATSGTKSNNDRYVMCAGKYDKNGWTIVFKAKSVNEAQLLVDINTNRRVISSNVMTKSKVFVA